MRDSVMIISERKSRIQHKLEYEKNDKRLLVSDVNVDN